VSVLEDRIFNCAADAAKCRSTCCFLALAELSLIDVEYVMFC